MLQSMAKHMTESQTSTMCPQNLVVVAQMTPLSGQPFDGGSGSCHAALHATAVVCPALRLCSSCSGDALTHMQTLTSPVQHPCR